MRDKEKTSQEKPWEKPYDYLKNAEDAVEGNYNMVDGILNNMPPPRDDLTDGQTYDEIRNLAPETLPEARQEKRPSVAALLKAPSKCVSNAKGKERLRHSTDREL